MIIKKLNKSGNWKTYWTKELKNALNKSSNSTTVGQNLILETDTFNVWSIHLKSGHSLPFHKHNKPYFYIAINNGKSRSFYADGSVIETEYIKDDIMHFKGLNEHNSFIHNLENIGETTLIFTTVEFK